MLFLGSLVVTAQDWPRGLGPASPGFDLLWCGSGQAAAVLKAAYSNAFVLFRSVLLLAGTIYLRRRQPGPP